MKHIPSLKTLLFELHKLPGVGPRSAYRLAEHLLKTNKKDVLALAESLLQTRERIKHCKTCFNFTENSERCFICEDNTRDQSIICVVEQPFDILKVEDCGAFRGIYHVLHGLISPLHHVNPEDITCSQLKARLSKHKVKELILAIDSSLSGDTTALYIAKMIHDDSIKISRLAHGIPIGGDLEYIDNRTLNQAIENRHLL